MAKKPTNKKPAKPGRRKQKTTGEGESRKTRPGRAAGRSRAEDVVAGSERHRLEREQSVDAWRRRAGVGSELLRQIRRDLRGAVRGGGRGLQAFGDAGREINGRFAAGGDAGDDLVVGRSIDGSRVDVAGRGAVVGAVEGSDLRVRAVLAGSGGRI